MDAGFAPESTTKYKESRSLSGSIQTGKTLERREIPGHAGEIDRERGVAKAFEPWDCVRRGLAGAARHASGRHKPARTGEVAQTETPRDSIAILSVNS